MIPISKPDIGPAEEEAVLDVLRSGMLAMGRKTAAFEEAWAAYCGVKHAVLMSNGTVAQEAVLHALGIGPGDEVITVSFSFNATVSVILRAGVRELAYSRALPLIDQLRAAGAEVTAFDPLLAPAEVEALGAHAWTWGDAAPIRVIVTQTADRQWARLDPAWFPELEVVDDGRNSLRALELPADVGYVGVGVQSATRRTAMDAAAAPDRTPYSGAPEHGAR